jgi:hypothetical protein
MEQHHDEQRTATPGWYADPTRQHQFRFFDGTAWTDQASDAMPLAGVGPDQRPPRKRKVWPWLALVAFLLLCACPLISVAALGGIGLNAMAKTDRLIATAPADGSAVKSMFNVASSSASAGRPMVTLSPLTSRLDMYAVALQPSYTYEINGTPSTMTDFYSATKVVGPKECEMTYTRAGIQSLNLLR